MSNGSEVGSEDFHTSDSDADLSLCNDDEEDVEPRTIQTVRTEEHAATLQLVYWLDTVMEAEEVTIHFQMPGPTLTFQNVRYFVNLKRKFLHRKAEVKEILKDVSVPPRRCSGRACLRT
ncbi:UNVERIFIED_CONTAM: hypothetical protein FKN15_040585 [Acipenser sinensis]